MSQFPLFWRCLVDLHIGPGQSFEHFHPTIINVMARMIQAFRGFSPSNVLRRFVDGIFAIFGLSFWAPLSFFRFNNFLLLFCVPMGFHSNGTTNSTSATYCKSACRLCTSDPFHVLLLKNWFCRFQEIKVESRTRFHKRIKPLFSL